LAVQNGLIAESKSLIDTATETFKDRANATKDKFVVLETRSLELFATHVQAIEEKFDALNVINKEEITELSSELKENLSSTMETAKLKLGDCGEKGDKGEDGFLSGVSKWEAGSITLENEAKTFANGLWICKVPQTATSPDVDSDWELVVDGISDIKMENSNIEVKFASGKTRNIGRVGFIHKGIYSEKKTYSKGDVVTINKTSFVSMEDDNTNNPPSNNWKLLSGKGDKGAKGDKGGNLDPSQLTTLIIDVVKGME